MWRVSGLRQRRRRGRDAVLGGPHDSGRDATLGRKVARTIRRRHGASTVEWWWARGSSLSDFGSAARLPPASRRGPQHHRNTTRSLHRAPPGGLPAGPALQRQFQRRRRCAHVAVSKPPGSFALGRYKIGGWSCSESTANRCAASCRASENSSIIHPKPALPAPSPDLPAAEELIATGPSE